MSEIDRTESELPPDGERADYLWDGSGAPDPEVQRLNIPQIPDLDLACGCAVGGAAMRKEMNNTQKQNGIRKFNRTPPGGLLT